MKILVLMGLPGSGKSTFAKEFVTKHKDWIRINRDDIRNMLGPYFMPKRENLVTQIEDNAIISALQNNFNVVLDATNLDKERNKVRFNKIVLKLGNVTIDYKYFDTSLAECIKRDLSRANSVGSEVILRMYNQYLAPKPVVYFEDKTLPHCVIFDIDGTLAKMNGRGPFDWHRVGEDLPKEHIVDLARTLKAAGNKIIVFTGRDGVCITETREWLMHNNIPYDEIFCRLQGNSEKDSIIKKRLFEENIRGRYYCKMVIDDRDQVVEMWRKELGLTCLQVDYGNF